MSKLLFTLLSFFAFTFTTNATGNGGKEKEITIQTNIYCDHCAACGDCKPKIETAVNVIKGVKWARLNVEAQTIKVVFNPEKTTEDDIRKAISNAGFTADDVPANPEAYAKLDACCKKPE